MLICVIDFVTKIIFSDIRNAKESIFMSLFPQKNNTVGKMDCIWNISGVTVSKFEVCFLLVCETSSPDVGCDASVLFLRVGMSNKFFADISTLRDETITLFRKVGNGVPSDAASHPRRKEISTRPLESLRNQNGGLIY
jgi:hypothetical protein